MAKRLLIVLALVPIVGGVLAYRSDSDFLTQPPWLRLVATEVEVEPPASTSYDSLEVHAQGLVEGGSQATEMRFEVPGRITDIRCSDEHPEPQVVRRGDILARIDHTCWLQELREAEAILAKARADKEKLVAGATTAELNEARAEVKAAAATVVSTFHTHRRLGGLAAEQIVAQQDLEDAAAAYHTAHGRWVASKARVTQLEDPPRQFELEAADADIQLAESRVRQSRARLHKSILRAPCDAVVLRVDGEVGELTGPDVAQPLVTLVDSDALRVRAFVDELDALEIEPGQLAEATSDSLPNVRLRGRVEACLATMEPKTHLRHAPTERQDVKVREVVIALELEQPQLGKLVYGLPVDVVIRPTGAVPRPRDRDNGEVLHATDDESVHPSQLASAP